MLCAFNVLALSIHAGFFIATVGFYSTFNLLTFLLFTVVEVICVSVEIFAISMAEAIYIDASVIVCFATANLFV